MPSADVQLGDKLGLHAINSTAEALVEGVPFNAAMGIAGFGFLLAGIRLVMRHPEYAVALSREYADAYPVMSQLAETLPELAPIQILDRSIA